MKVGKVYQNYQTPKSLQEHMLEKKSTTAQERLSYANKIKTFIDKTDKSL